jgi:putative restriction endonuclease
VNFKEWMNGKGLSQSTALKYDGAMNGILTEWAIENKLVEGSLTLITDIAQFRLIVAKVQKLSIYRDWNERSHHMYSSAMIKYAGYLSEGQGKTDIESDIESIINDPSINTTDKGTYIKTRIGQGIFRQKLIEYWKGCSATNFKDVRLLIASHIKPWRHSTDRERLDPFNGLLLMPNLDRVFDAGLVTFSEDGLIKISEKLIEPKKLGINDDMRISLTSEHQLYMNFHRSEIYNKSINL